MTNRFLVSAALLPLSLIACGGSSSATEPTPVGKHYHFVVNSVIAPTSDTDEQLIRVDNNHKPVETGGQLVNALGGLLGTLKSVGNVDVQTPLTSAVNTGAITLLADYQAADITMDTVAAGFEVFIGTNPMPAPCTGSDTTVCGNQLKGTGTFDVTPNTNPPLGGKTINGKFDGGPGEVEIEFSLSTGSGAAGAPLTLNLLDAHAELTGLSATGVTTGLIGGAISQDDINNMLIPTIATQIQAEINSECLVNTPHAAPSCGCVSGSGIATVLSLLDTNMDCMVTPAEIMTNATVSSLLQPDVAIGGNTENALSVGIGFTAVGATYTVAGETDTP